MEPQLSHQDINKKLSDLTLAVYRVTGLFPEGEASAHRIRERAIEILEDLTFYGTVREKDVSEKKDFLHASQAKIQILFGLFKIARIQGFVKDLNFDILELEYRGVLDFIEGELQNEKSSFNDQSLHEEPHSIEEEVYKIETGVIPNESLADILMDLSERQRQLLGFFKNNGSARLKEVVGLFPAVGEKTIRNDLKTLCERHVLMLNGKAPQSYYSLR